LAVIGKINLALSTLGAATFAALLFYITFAPSDFDRRVSGFAVGQVQKRVDADLNRLAGSRTVENASRVAGVFSGKLRQRIDRVQAKFRDTGPLIVAVLSAACKLDCQKRERARGIIDSYRASITQYGIALDKINDVVIAHYQATMNRLRTDVKIFAVSNFLAFVFAAALSLFRRPAARHLLPISFALTVATLLAIVWYVFGQDWVMAIIFGRYWGWAYGAFLSVLTLFMVDIAINKARITSVVLDAFGSAAGSAFAPC